VEELPCELVREWHFLELGVLAKQLRSQRKRMEVEEVERQRERDGVGKARRARSVLGLRSGGGRERKVSAGSAPRSESRHQKVRKNAAHKGRSQKKSHVHRAKFNGRPKLPGWLGKRWHSSKPRPAMVFIEGGG
jgi:hypothetical protein